MTVGLIVARNVTGSGTSRVGVAIKEPAQRVEVGTGHTLNEPETKHTVVAWRILKEFRRQVR